MIKEEILKVLLLRELSGLAGVNKSTTPYHHLGNGMVQRFNQTILKKILGTLEEHQKQDWVSYVATRLTTDGYLGLNSSQESDCSSREHFASKLINAWTLSTRQHLKKQIQVPQGISSIMRVKSEKQPSMYGVRMLIRKVGLKVKGRWDKHSYIVIEIPNKGISVYRVQRISGASTVKTQQRDL